MAPRAGGEADKFGNRYEGRWTVRQLLRVLTGEARSIKVEDFGDVARGAEFTLRLDKATEVHQVKRQNGDLNEWTIGQLAAKGIWDAAQRHAAAGREYHFVSTIPAALVNELCTRARRAASADAFVQDWLTSKTLKAAFDEMAASSLLGSPQAAWEVLVSLYVSWPDEREVANSNAALAGQIFGETNGRSAAAALSELVLDNLGSELTSESMGPLLADYELTRVTPEQTRATRGAVEAVTAKWVTALESQLLRPPIARGEFRQISAALDGADSHVLFVVGGAGSGKSAVLRDVVVRAQSKDAAVLAFRLDRLPEFWSTQAIGELLDLPTSPVPALKAAMGESRPGVLVIDQLDAVSVLSGRTPANFAAVADLIQEAAAYENMRVILACRRFDLDNDPQIRALSSQSHTATFEVSALSDDQINASVTTMGLDAARLTKQQRAILRAPLHLILLQNIADETNALGFQTGTHLFDAFWDRKALAVEQRRPGTRFAAILTTLAEYMSGHQRLSAPRLVLDRLELTNESDVLVSEHVLVRDGSLLAFFHETFFDYAFSRYWIGRDETLVQFLAAGEQELFRRAQVRQILTHLRDTDPARFAVELRDLLTNQSIRFHIKTAALSIAGAVPNPTSAECDVLLDVADVNPLLAGRINATLRSPVWFDRLDADGHIEDWLSGADTDQDRAADIMSGAASTQGDRIAELLRGLRGRPGYERRARWVLRFPQVSGSRALFGLLVEIVAAGAHDDAGQDTWLSMYRLGEQQPAWGVELLKAYLIDRPGAFDLDDSGHVARIEANDHQGVELMAKAAKAAPAEFVGTFLPYVLKVMEITGSPRATEGLAWDKHFTHRFKSGNIMRSFDDALFAALTDAMKSLVVADPLAARPILDQLAADRHDGAQALLYDGLIAGADAFHGWAAALLLEDRSRLLCGYTDNSVWKTRELIVAIAPFLADDEMAKLEDALRDLRFSWEPRNGSGWAAFNLLSGLPESRLSDVGRRRLGEMRRRFESEQPVEPQGITSGTFRSPISNQAAEHMTDDNWLRAMRKHTGEREDWAHFSGGVHEFAQVVRHFTKAQPERFAMLALRLKHEMHPAYADAILMGLGDAEPLADPSPVFDAVRHVVSLGHTEPDRWIDMALRHYLVDVPQDLVELVLQRALSNPDPADNGMRVWSKNRETGEQVGDIRGSGVNTARGSLAEALADLVITDGAQGARTTLIVPKLKKLAADPSLPVRTCVARLLSATLRHARPDAIEAMAILLDADDAILATQPVLDLLMYVGTRNPEFVIPVVARMLSSKRETVREVGGQLACLAGLEWGDAVLLQDVLNSDDAPARKGVALVAAVRVARTANPTLASEVLTTLFDDDDSAVRSNAASVAGELRDGRLRSHARLLKSLIGSAAFREASPQLLLTLDHAVERVDDLALLVAKRFVEVHGPDASDIRTSAAADGREVAQLIVRGLAQSTNSRVRSELLDLLDRLLEIGAWGIDDVVSESERAA